MKDYNRNVKLFCPTCGNDQFSTLEETDDLVNASNETNIQCSDCKSVFTKAQLIDENQYVINENIEDLKREIIKDLEKGLKTFFK